MMSVLSSYIFLLNLFLTISLRNLTLCPVCMGTERPMCLCGWTGCQLLESTEGCRQPWACGARYCRGSQCSWWSEWGVSVQLLERVGSRPPGTGAGTVCVLKTTYWGGRA